MAGALAWASGIWLYPVLFLLGIAAQLYWITITQSMHLLKHPYVMTASGMLFTIKFFADKIPGVDSIWDAIHISLRIPAGALLAAGVIGTEDVPAWAVAAGLFGGTITAGTHLTKPGNRAIVNTSPEPFSNWVASLSEEAMAFGGLWLVFHHPAGFLMLRGLIVLLMLWLLLKLWRAIKVLGGRLAVLLGLRFRFSTTI